jgi:hypothetical protein
MARRRDAAFAAVLAAAMIAVALLTAPHSGAAGEPEFGCKKIHRGKAQIARRGARRSRSATRR